jgi:hypothetical protein
MNMRQYLKSSVLYFDREYFGKKQVHNFKTLENCYRLQPPACVTLDVRDSFILQSVLRQVRSLFQSEFSTVCDLVLPLSISSIFSFP